MSRAIVGEFVLWGDLVTDSALSVGSGVEGPSADITCVRDGLGRLVIPGSALAGAFAARFEKEAAWGGQERASHLYFEDAVHRLLPKSANSVERRDGVAIDRRTGTAARGLLFSREVVPAGSRFSWELRVEATDAGASVFGRDDAKEWITTIANVLAGGINLGGGTSAGLGRVRLESARLQWIGIGDRNELLQFLGNPDVKGEALTLEPLTPAGLRIEVPWRAVGPLLVSVPLNGLVDRMPQSTRLCGRERRLVIPGTSLKGALRSRAEWIVRTAASLSTPIGPLDQMAAPLGPVQRLFGKPPMGRGRARKPGMKGMMRVSEVLATEPVDNWDGILAVLVEARPADKGDAGLTKRANLRRAAAVALRQGRGLLRINDHVAISRWTGGADDGKLFATVAPLPRPDYWQPIVLDVDLSRPEGVDDRAAEFALLALVLRDLCDGWIGIGHGTTRGYGEVAVDPAEVTWTFGDQLPTGLETVAGRSFTLAELLDPGHRALADVRQLLLGCWLAELSTIADANKEGVRDGVTR